MHNMLGLVGIVRISTVVDNNTQQGVWHQEWACRALTWVLLDAKMGMHVLQVLGATWVGPCLGLQQMGSACMWPLMQDQMSKCLQTVSASQHVKVVTTTCEVP